jgi:hypothetical protein
MSALDPSKSSAKAVPKAKNTAVTVYTKNFITLSQSVNGAAT